MEQEMWYEVVVRDPSCLSGKTFACLFKLIEENTELKVVRISHLEGSHTQELGAENAFVALDIRKVIPKMESVRQIDWGDFFFFENEEEKCDFDAPYSKTIRHSHLVVRAIDSSDIYVYTKYPKFINVLERQWPELYFSKVDLEKITYPE